MQSEIKKITRIINEMTYVLMKKGSIDLEVKVKKIRIYLLYILLIIIQNIVMKIFVS